MPRSSRHKSHRSNKHSSRDARELSDSEDDGSLKDRRHRVEEAGPGSGARVSKYVEPQKRKSCSSILKSQEKDKSVTENGDCSAEHGRKQKERGEDCVTPDRWNGGGKEDGLAEKGSKEEVSGPAGHEKAEKSRISTVESKNRSSRRRESSLERYGESNSRAESLKKRSEKEYSSGRRDGRDDKEMDIERISERANDRERASERDKKVQDSRHGKSDDVEIMIHSTRKGVAEEHRTTKKDSTDFQIRDDMDNAELEKDLEKCFAKRRNSSGGIDKWQDDCRNSEDKRLSCRDDHVKNGSHKVEGHKDERYKDDRYREKYYKDLDRDQRHREIRHREERSSRDYISNRLESKSVRDRDKSFESYSKKSKLHGIDLEVSPHGDNHVVKSRDTGARRRSYDENDEHYSLKHRNVKETRSDVEKDASNSSKLEYRHQGKVDYSLTNNLSKSSPSPNTHSSKDQNRSCIKQAEHAHREPISDDRTRLTDDHGSISVVHKRVSESLSSKKIKRRNRVNSDDREQQLSVDNPSMNNHFQADLHNSEHVPVPPSPFKRTSHFPCSSPVHLLSHPPMRTGMDAPTIYEDENRSKSGDRRSINRYKRNSDPSIERGHGLTWKNGPTWPAPVPNGFIPFQHGPSAGFHSAIQHFPLPSFFGARPYMEINQAGIPYHMPEVVDRFSGHGHPFGWHRSADDSCPSQMQGWDGSTSLFGDKSQAYGRPDWEQNRHLIGRPGWELNAEMWKGHSLSMNVEFCAPQELADESKGAYSSPCSNSEGDHFQCVSGDTTHSKEHKDPPENKSLGTSLEGEFGRTSLPCKRRKDDSLNLCNYFSRFEISADLIDQELYKEIMNHFATGNSTGFYNIYKDEDSKNNKIQILAMVSKPNSLPSTAAYSAFQRAMSVYEKQNHGRKVKPTLAIIPSEEGNNSPVATDANEIKALSSFPITKEALPANTISVNEMEMLETNKSVASPLEEDDAKNSHPGYAESSPAHIAVEHVDEAESSPAHIAVEHVDESPGYNNSKQQSGLISDVLMESSQACEVIMPDCKVNLSRIHNPTESTH